MDDIKIVKYDTLIHDVDELLEKRIDTWRFGDNIGNLLYCNECEAYERVIKVINVSLLLIYDYEKMNEFAKVIIEQSSIFITNNSSKDIWVAYYMDYLERVNGDFKDTKLRIEATKKLVQYCQKEENISEAYKFIFWALLVLTVDKTDAEEYLSLICNFAKMLHISDGEFEDIIYIIKFIYDDAPNEYTFKSKSVPDIFAKVLKR